MYLPNESQIAALISGGKNNLAKMKGQKGRTRPGQEVFGASSNKICQIKIMLLIRIWQIPN